MYLQLRPLGFISTGSRLHRGLYVRFLRWHMAIKPTRRELFSERYGYTRTLRLAGVSLTLRRVSDPA